MENKYTYIVFASTFAVLIILFFILEKSFSAGLIAGFTTGAVNYFLIAATVKKLVVPGGSAGAGKALVFIGIYLGKLVLFGLLVIGLLVFRKYYNITGFLIGFTVNLIEIGVVYFVFTIIKRR